MVVLELEDNTSVAAWIFSADLDRSEVSVKAEGQGFDWLGD